MTSFLILDTGYISASTAIGIQKQLTDVNRAGYTGSQVSAITLKQGNVSRSSDAGTDSKRIVNSNSPSPTALISVSNPVYNINFILQKSDNTSGWDDNELIQITRLETTYGVKLLYVDNAESVTGYTNLVQAMGRKNILGNFSHASPSEDNGTVSTTTPYLIGRVKSLNISDSPDGTYWRISFNFEETG